MIIKIPTYNELTDENKERIKELMDVFVKRQNIRPVTEEDIKRVMERDENILIAAYENNEIVGVLVLVQMNIFTGKVGLIEEVVVLKVYQNHGIATRILQEAIRVAREKNMDFLKINTNVKNPSNRLYQKLGFIQKDDNLYKLLI